MFDEAHRLRNVYEPGSRIAGALRDATEGRQKVLLTATPLQNSFLELYGLASFQLGATHTWSEAFVNRWRLV